MLNCLRFDVSVKLIRNYFNKWIDDQFHTVQVYDYHTFSNILFNCDLFPIFRNTELLYIFMFFFMYSMMKLCFSTISGRFKLCTIHNKGTETPIVQLFSKKISQIYLNKPIYFQIQKKLILGFLSNLSGRKGRCIGARTVQTTAIYIRFIVLGSCAFYSSSVIQIIAPVIDPILFSQVYYQVGESPTSVFNDIRFKGFVYTRRSYFVIHYLGVFYLILVHSLSVFFYVK